jgi:hypothetical protein
MDAREQQVCSTAAGIASARKLKRRAVCCLKQKRRLRKARHDQAEQVQVFEGGQLACWLSSCARHSTDFNLENSNFGHVW